VIVLDANVLVALLDPGDVHHDMAESLLREHVDDRKVVSVLTMAEFLVHPAMHGTIETAVQSVALIGVEVLPLPASDASGLATTRARSRLKMPDAVVLHTAQTVHGAIMTLDQDLARAATLVGLPTVGLSAGSEEPTPMGEGGTPCGPDVS